MGRPAPFTFPLIEWIDRRMGGELVTCKDENGQGAIRLRTSQAGNGSDLGNSLDIDSFFESLRDDELTPEELDLRQAMFDLFESRATHALTLDELCEDKMIADAHDALMMP